MHLKPKLATLLTALSLTGGGAFAAPTSLLDFEFDEGAGNKITDSINSLVGTPGNPGNPPTFSADAPSRKNGDFSIQFTNGQYMVVSDPDKKLQFDTNNPSFTLQAWVKFAGNPAGRMVFFYNNGPGGAVSFSVNTDRTIFVTTLGIKDQTSTAAIPDDGNWHHIAVIHENGVEFRFYVDGALADTEPYTGGVFLNRPTAQSIFSIGAEWNGALQFVGQIDRLKVSSGMLKPDELDYQSAPPIALADFEFNEGSGTKVTDSVNSLVGLPGNSANSPTFTTDAPSAQAGDTGVQFATGQYFQVNDPTTVLQFDTNNPSFTMEAWVKVAGNPAGRMVFFYSNGKGGAVSFSINTDRTIFVTTLGIKDQNSTAAVPDDGNWHHIAVIHENGKEFRFYVDGVLSDTEPYTGGVFLNRPTAQSIFSIGAEWNGALQFTGEVDRLKIFSGMLAVSQLDSQAIPPAGAAALTFASPTASPLGFSITVNHVGGSLADTNTIDLTLNGGTVIPTSVLQSRTTTIIAYTLPGTPFPAGSTNAVTLKIKDNKGSTYQDNASFVVGAYASLPSSAALPDSAVDMTKVGFKIKAYQIDGPSATDTNIGTIAYNEALLAGQFGPNIATTPDPVFGDMDTNGYYTWGGVINLDTNPSANDGYFTDPDYPQNLFPGIPGATVNGNPNENFVEEIVAALDFKTPGLYTMAVVTDWTGFPDQDDGFQLRAGINPQDPASSVVIGFFDSAAPAGPARGVANSPLQFYVPKAGSYPFRLLYYQSTGGGQLEWIMLNPDGTRSLINDVTNSVTAYYKWTTPAAPPSLSIARTSGGIVLTFTGTLQSASSLAGPWIDLPGTSPLTVTTSSGPAMQFYRSKR